jgi:hypothetical protein
MNVGATDLSLVVARIFGSTSYYGTQPRTTPLESPVVFEAFPTPDAQGEIHLGAIPEELLDAQWGRMALGRVMLSGLFGVRDLPADPDERFLAARAEYPRDALLKDDLKWFVTILVRYRVPGVSIPNSFALPENCDQLADDYTHQSEEVLNLLQQQVSRVCRPHLLERIVLDTRVFFFAEGLHAAGMPVLEPGRIGIAAQHQLDQLQQEISRLRDLDLSSLAKASWIVRGARWQRAVHSETDPWKRFLFAYTGLEQITHKVFSAVRPLVADRIRLETSGDTSVELPEPLQIQERYGQPAYRFAVVACALFPEDPSEVVAQFTALKEVRDRFAHGDLNELEPPAVEASQLLDAVLAAAETVAMGNQ